MNFIWNLEKFVRTIKETILNSIRSIKLLSSIGQKKIDKRMIVSYLIDISILFLIILLIILLDDNSIATTLPILGLCIIFLSIYICVKVRYSKLILLLFSIIAFVNISIGISDLIQLGKFVADWQLYLRAQFYNVYTAKSILLFLGILNVFFNTQWSKKNALVSDNLLIFRKSNSLIALVGIISLFVILLFGSESVVTNSTNGYISNNNPIYEYFVVIFIVTWYYSGKKKFLDILLLLTSAIYVIQSFYYGDRSAAFLMLILYFLLYFWNKISLSKVLILAIIAILFSNFIAEFRDADSSTFSDILLGTVDRGLYSDTVSYAYYTSITITALNHYDENIENGFLEYLKGYLLGSSNNDYSNLAVYAREHYKDLFNRGGGLYPSYFYAFFGYFGVVISTIILSMLLRYFFSRKSEKIFLYQVLIVTFGIRWYLYNPINLFRVVLIVFTILFFISSLINVLTKRK